MTGDAGNMSGPVLRFVQQPQTAELDGHWHAWYPGLDYVAVADTKDDAVAQLSADFDNRVADPAFRDVLFALAQRSLENPEPGSTAELLTSDQYATRLGQISDGAQIQVLAETRMADPNE